MTTPTWQGTGVALITPFTPEGAVDVSALKRLVQHVVQGGVDYLVPMGTTAEGATLTDDELYACTDTILETNNGRLPVLMGCGGNNTAAVAAKMQAYAKRFAVQGFLSVSPYYNRPQQDGIFLHYRALSEASPLPIVLYNVPPRTGSNVLPETVLRIAHACPNIVAVKEASGSLEQGMKIIANKPAHFQVLSGDDVLALPGIAIGNTGLISVAANARPRETSELVRLAMQGSFTQAAVLHYKLLPLIELLFKEGNPAGVKAACAAMGLCTPHVRLPLADATPALQHQINEVLIKFE